MGCEIKGYCKHTWELGRVVPKVAEVVVGIRDSDLGTQVSYQSINGYQVLLYSSMCSGLSLLPLLDSHIVG